MTQTQERPQTDDVDSLAREYIQAFMVGKGDEVLANRPDSFGAWDSPISHLERVFFLARGNTQAFVDAVAVLRKNDPEFNNLMQPPPAPGEIEIPDDLSFPALPDNCVFSPELARGACKFLDRYDAFSREASPEGYDDYHVFGGVWAMSVANARRSYISFGLERFYGNLMIGLFGKSSLFAKSMTAGVAKHVLEAAGLGHLIAPSRPSPSKLLSNMAGTRIPVDFEDWTIEKQEQFKKTLAMSAQKGMYFDELGKFIQSILRKGSTTSDFAEIFLTLDNCPAVYGQDTHARNVEIIEQPYLALLGAITPPNLKENAKSGADFWTDGFWGRFSFLAAPPGAYKDAPLDPGALEIPATLISALRNWHERLGVPDCVFEGVVDESGKKTGRYRITRDPLPEHECTMDRDAILAWKRYRSALKKMIADFPHEDFSSNYARLPGTAIRIAVLIASLENNGRIDFKHWAKAQELAEILRRNLHELYRQVNQSNYISQAAKLEEDIMSKMRFLRDKGVNGMSVAVLHHSYMKNTGAKELTDSMDGLVNAGLLKKETTNRTTKYVVL